jgi:hypothetical protein
MAPLQQLASGSTRRGFVAGIVAALVTTSPQAALSCGDGSSLCTPLSTEPLTARLPEAVTFIPTTDENLNENHQLSVPETITETIALRPPLLPRLDVETKPVRQKPRVQPIKYVYAVQPIKYVHADDYTAAAAAFGFCGF